MDALEFLLQTLVIPSVSGHEETLAKFLCKQLQDYGIDTSIDKVGNVIGSIGSGHEEILLVGHMDTVPGGPKVRVEGKKIYGRGAVDAKGSLCTFIQVLNELQMEPIWQSSLAREWRITVIGTVEEEIASSKGAYFIKDKYQPNYCIIGEPSGWNGLTLGYKGCLRLEALFSQASSHSAGPGYGIADKAIQAWQKIKIHCQQFNRNRTILFEQLQARLIAFQSSVEKEKDIAKIRIHFRLPLDFEQDNFIESLKHDLKEADNIEIYGVETAYCTARNTPLTPAFSQTVRKQGSRLIFKHKTGTSDMNVLGPIWQCPMIAYGPGDSSLDHTTNEHLHLSDYLRAIKVLQESLQIIMQLS